MRAEPERCERCRSPWQALPWLLRLVALFSLCLIATATAVYLLVRLLSGVTALTVAIIAAALLAALLHPLTRLLCRWRLPRTLAALLTVLVFLGALGAVVALVIGQVATQFENLGQTLANGLREIRQVIVSGPLPISDEQLDGLGEGLRRYLSRSDEETAASASSTFEALGGAFLAVFLLFFLLRDGDRMWRWLLARLPDRHRARVAAAGSVGWSTLSRYVGGQVLVAAVDGIGVAIALVLINVPMVAPLALLTFLGGFVPIVGATVAGAAAVLVALVANGPTAALLVLAAVIAVQQLEGNLLEPLIVGRALRLHPVPVLLAVTAGTLAAGILGAVIAVPTMAVLYRSGSVLIRDPDVERSES